ncbi:hypothetical protein BD560DRAFT_448407, partial [Blakeslea trispora]
MYAKEDILDTKKFTTETFTLLSRMVDVIVNKRLDDRNIAKLEPHQALIELLGITDYAAQKAINIHCERSEPSEKKHMGRPPHQLQPEYIFASQPREGESLSDSKPQIPTNSKYRSYIHKTLGEVRPKASPCNALDYKGLLPTSLLQDNFKATLSSAHCRISPSPGTF